MISHNPDCGTSRNVLDFMRKSGADQAFDIGLNDQPKSASAMVCRTSS